MNYKIVAITEAVILIAVTASFAVYGMYFTNQPIRLSGAGATFPAPLIQKWSAEFKDMTGVQINYEGIGSGGGVKQFTEKTVDFGASDPPMKEAEFSAAPGTLHIPITIGGVVPIYNIPGIPEGLNFSGQVLADIFRLNITRWSDPRITTINPGVTLPDAEIIVCRRSDSSGTTKVFTSFLSDESAAWKATYGAANVIDWPSQTIGGKGNPGVAAAVQQNPNSIGYVELSYALESNISYGKVQNAAGKFVEPTLETLAAAASAVSLILPPGDASWASVGSYFNLHNVEGADNAYPITSFSYILVYKELNVRSGMTLEKAKALTWFLWWAVHDGQHYASGLSYVPLPQAVVTHNEATLRMITFNGQQVNDWA
ncbi:MAG: phosphate ABC transporter substrate-binding protein PstS [Candidatus Bathyarchaeota archaeon]|nr:phosphate ABC transporter substrate-binding protein PstS [Candidatus Bathyarchaeota archaeon]